MCEQTFCKIKRDCFLVYAKLLYLFLDYESIGGRVPHMAEVIIFEWPIRLVDEAERENNQNGTEKLKSLYSSLRVRR